MTQAEAIRKALTAALTADSAEQGRQWFEAQLAEDGYVVTSTARAAQLLDVERAAAEQGMRLIRAHWALKILDAWALGGEGYHAGACIAMRDWIRAGGPQNPVPWVDSAFFDSWARKQGWEPHDGAVSMKITMQLTPEVGGHG